MSKHDTTPKWHGNPGSAEAVEKGCTCPQIDNHHGAGYPRGNYERGWWVRSDCKLHSGVQEEDR